MNDLQIISHVIKLALAWSASLAALIILIDYLMESFSGKTRG